MRSDTQNWDKTSGGYYFIIILTKYQVSSLVSADDSVSTNETTDEFQTNGRYGKATRLRFSTTGPQFNKTQSLYSKLGQAQGGVGNQW